MRTGYTVELGVELFVPNEELSVLWKKFLSSEKVKPCGLAARDILRFEMGYALYRRTLGEEINPAESGAAWTVQLEDHDFWESKRYIKKTIAMPTQCAF